jgi:hypothetical protein
LIADHVREHWIDRDEGNGDWKFGRERTACCALTKRGREDRGRGAASGASEHGQEVKWKETGRMGLSRKKRKTYGP